MPFNIKKNRIAPSLFLLAALAAPAAGQTQPSAQTPAAADTAAACACESSPLPEVLATVNGVRITRQDISPAVQKKVADLQRRVVEARRNELDLQINSALLEAEAKKRGLSAAKLLESEVNSKTTEPTEADAQKFYDENRARIGGEFKDVKGDIVAYLRDVRRRDAAAKFSESLRAAAQLKRLAAEATPPANEADRARVFANVNGRDITSADVEESLRPLVYGVQEQVYRLRTQEVELRVNDLLLGAEAQRRGVTPRALLDAEVVSKIPAVTEADAQKFYDENRARIEGDFAKTKEQILQYLRDLAERKALTDFAARMRAGAQVQTFLVAPAAPVYKIATDGQPSKGNPAAAVTVVEFTDYQCPSCAAAQPALQRIMAEYGDRVRLVVRDFPLSQHADAARAAEAAEAAREQGKFWEYTTLLYQNQSALQVEKLKEYASRVGLDRAKFDAALDSGRFADSVRRDLQDGERAGVGGTPTVFVNGVRVERATYELLKAAIDAALKTARAE
ncbi:MAG TPA: thioredoxin domain-containing protein [Pyrinomonadaceae bacterium]|nr:thioredoxin domain-containing protein [Pyrinomonadaceae bacterium]